MKEVINNKLPFTPTCPNCKCAVSIERYDYGGYYVRCENCNNDWVTSSFSNVNDEVEWIEQFHNSYVEEPNPTELPYPGPSDTKIMMEIAHASDTLEKAYDLVRQAHDLINEDKVARQYIKFNATVAWHQFVWNILMKQFNQDNPDSKETYHLRAFNYYGIHPGMLVGDNDTTSGN